MSEFSVLTTKIGLNKATVINLIEIELILD